MGIWIYLAREAGDPHGDDIAILQDSVTGTFFGTAFHSEDQAESFLNWCDDEDIDSRFLAEDWPLAVEAWQTDLELGERDPLRCRIPYCFAIEPAGSGWGLCLHHAIEEEVEQPGEGRRQEPDFSLLVEESHRDCRDVGARRAAGRSPGCDDCTPANLTEKDEDLE